jgi:hypothetical protein
MQLFIQTGPSLMKLQCDYFSALRSKFNLVKHLNKRTTFFKQVDQYVLF